MYCVWVEHDVCYAYGHNTDIIIVKWMMKFVIGNSHLYGKKYLNYCLRKPPFHVSVMVYSYAIPYIYSLYRSTAFCLWPTWPSLPIWTFPFPPPYGYGSTVSVYDLKTKFTHKWDYTVFFFQCPPIPVSITPSSLTLIITNVRKSVLLKANTCCIFFTSSMWMDFIVCLLRTALPRLSSCSSGILI